MLTGVLRVIAMQDIAYYVVEAVDATYHHTPDQASNEHRIGLPIVAGPFDDEEQALQEAMGPHTSYSDGFMAVAIPSDEVPDDAGE